jgi:galactoside O-acetyltransferase
VSSAAVARLPRRALPAGARARARRLLTRGVVQQPRIWKYRALSTCRPAGPEPIVHQPVLYLGAGAIVLGEDVEFGWPNSPLFYAGYCHLEAVSAEASIELGDRVQINNNAYIKSEGAGILIAEDGLLGSGIEIFDSDFHELHPDRRRGGRPAMAPVVLERNVFVGNGARILKGVTIGAHSVIGAGSVVVSSIPEGVIAAGNPARVVREL